MEEDQVYREMYLHLFNKVTDALEAIGARNYGQAEQLLREAQRETEERYLAATDTADDD